MAVVNQIKKTIRMELWDIVRFQISLHCYLKNIAVTDQVLDSVTTLALVGEKDLSDFCDLVSGEGMFRNSQSARTALASVEKKGLIRTYKPKKGRKRISLHSDVRLSQEGNILLDIKIVRIDTKEG